MLFIVFLIILPIFNFQSPLSVRVINLYWCAIGLPKDVKSLCLALGIDLTKPLRHLAVHLLQIVGVACHEFVYKFVVPFVSSLVD